jgi:hypothetical protein
VRRGEARYTGEINEVLEVGRRDRRSEITIGTFPIFEGNRSLGEQTQHLLNYGSATRCQRYHAQRCFLEDSDFAKDFHARRVAQKAIFYRLPARPLVKWIYMMFIRRAILDGRAGIAFANLQAIYEYFIVLKSRELTQNSP